MEKLMKKTFDSNMLRKSTLGEVEEIMDIWMESNLTIHDFISPSHWKLNASEVLDAIKKGVLVACVSGEILGFALMEEGYIQALFVKKDYRSQGIGKIFLDHYKQLEDELTLHVFIRNMRAVNFYLREGFVIIDKIEEELTMEEQFFMIWKKPGPIVNLP